MANKTMKTLTIGNITYEIYDEVARTTLVNKQDISPKVSGTGNISVTVVDNTEYSYTEVTSLTMIGGLVNCHGFITFGASAPTITVSGFDASSGDDITSATASEVWEFSVWEHDNKSYVIWKNWSA